MDPEQESALDLALHGNNVFITGPGGTGKSFLLGVIVDKLRDAGRQVAVTAMTGVAAAAVGGTTLHMLIGLSASARSHRAILAGMRRKHVQTRLRRVDVLIVDEASMLSAELLRCIDTGMRIARGRPKEPCGGMQVIMFGDFHQLPPIENRAQPNEADEDDFFQNSGLAFQSPSWRDMKVRTVKLHHPHRHCEDVELARILSRIRDGSPDDASSALRQLASECERPLPPHPDGVQPTRIYTRNVDVERINAAELADATVAADGLTMTFRASDSVQMHAKPSDRAQPPANYLRSCPAPETLRLCRGAQVILVKNLDVDARLVNGSRGIVTGICHVTGSPIVRFADARVGERTIPRTEFKVECQSNGVSITAKRVQVPLRLAYAITAHRAQGMSLDFAIVSLSGTFCPGQAYVALSRVRTRAGLQVEGIPPAGQEQRVLMRDTRISALDADSPPPTPRASSGPFGAYLFDN